MLETYIKGEKLEYKENGKQDTGGGKGMLHFLQTLSLGALCVGLPAFRAVGESKRELKVE